MNIAVCIKQTPDTTTRIQIAEGGSEIVEEGIQWIISPYDEFAIEEALKLAEANGGEVTIVSMGPARVEKTWCTRSTWTIFLTWNTQYEHKH